MDGMAMLKIYKLGFYNCVPWSKNHSLPS